MLEFLPAGYSTGRLYVCRSNRWPWSSVARKLVIKHLIQIDLGIRGLLKAGWGLLLFRWKDVWFLPLIFVGKYLPALRVGYRHGTGQLAVVCTQQAVNADNYRPHWFEMNETIETPSMSVCKFIAELMLAHNSAILCLQVWNLVWEIVFVACSWKKNPNLFPYEVNLATLHLLLNPEEDLQQKWKSLRCVLSFYSASAKQEREAKCASTKRQLLLKQM